MRTIYEIIWEGNFVFQLKQCMKAYFFLSQKGGGVGQLGGAFPYKIM